MYICIHTSIHTYTYAYIYREGDRTKASKMTQWIKGERARASKMTQWIKVLTAKFETLVPEQDS